MKNKETIIIGSVIAGVILLLLAIPFLEILYFSYHILLLPVIVLELMGVSLIFFALGLDGLKLKHGIFALLLTFILATFFDPVISQYIPAPETVELSAIMNGVVFLPATIFFVIGCWINKK